MSTAVVQIECRCGGRLDFTVTSPHIYLAARERKAFDDAHADCRADATCATERCICRPGHPNGHVLADTRLNGDPW